MSANPSTQPTPDDHKTLALWAAECAEHVLPLFEQMCPQDERPRNAIEAGRAWVRGELAMVNARKAAFAAHAAARDATHPAAVAAARSAGHAAATAHVASHARHAAAYAVTAARAAAPKSENESVAALEREWQSQHLPEHLGALAFSASHKLE